MLTELKLTNFRIFDDEVTVRFRPITVFIGRNSSGKSSIVKFLLMLQQSTGPGKSQFLSPEGDSVRLGDFSELKNSLSKTRKLTFELVADSSTTQFDDDTLRRLKLAENVRYSDLLHKIKGTVSYGRKTTTGRTSYGLVEELTGRNLLSTSTRILDDSTFLDIPSTLGIGSETEEFPDLSSESGHTKKSLESFNRQLERRLALHRRHLAEIILLSTLRHEVHSIRHLSPIRDEAQRVIQASYPPLDYVGQRGQYTLPHLQQMIIGDRERYEFIQPHLENVAGLASIEFKTTTGYISRAFARNKTTGANVLIADYGFGVSQCLPIFVQGVIMPPFTSLMVEQPEAQLHPTAQLELGSFFAELWKERKVGSIIETHSDNILLRLRRLIAKGQLSHEDVSVAFFTFDEDNGNMPIVKNLDINEDGSMQSGLPMEFFGADIIEGLNLGARE